MEGNVMSKGKNIEQYKQLHSKVESYGTTSVSYINEVCLIIDFLKPKSILDYGCGKGTLINKLKSLYPNVEIIGYDPAIPGIDKLPENIKVDLIINTDVLEHIPEDEIDSTIYKIKSISDNVYFNLHHALACALLPDGTNAHCTVRNKYWYNAKFSEYFPVITFLDGVEPWQSTVCTFAITTDVWEKYADIIQKRKNVRKIYLRIKPIYDPIRPLILPFVKILKKIVYGI